MTKAEVRAILYEIGRRSRPQDSEEVVREWSQKLLQTLLRSPRGRAMLEDVN